MPGIEREYKVRNNPNVLKASGRPPLLRLLLPSVGTTLLWLLAFPAHAQSVTSYADLQDAASAATGEALLVLAGDILDGAEQLTVGRSLTLNLNGHSLTIELSQAVSEVSNGIKLSSGVTLTIMDSNPGTNALTVVTQGTDLTTSNGHGAAINTSEGTLVISSGKVIAHGSGMAAGIGGGLVEDGGTIRVEGGTVIAKGGNRAAGIGGGLWGDGGQVTINGGTVEAEGGDFSAGIGCGSSFKGGSIVISNGVVKAKGIGGCHGGEVLISGGTLTSEAKSGAGIGGKKIVISGGNIEATGSGGGPGIGGPVPGIPFEVFISGGEIIANGSDSVEDDAVSSGAGIGGGEGYGGGTLVIVGGTLEANGGHGFENYGGGAGIGSGGGSPWSTDTTSGTIFILGEATVTARGGNSEMAGAGAGIGSGGAGVGGTLGAAGDAANPIVIESSVVFPEPPRGGAGGLGGHGAAIGMGGEESVEGEEAEVHTVTVTYTTGGFIALRDIPFFGDIPLSGNLEVSNDSSLGFAIVPHAGYWTVSVTVDGDNLGAIESHDFENVLEAASITAVFATFVPEVAIEVVAPVTGAAPQESVLVCGEGFVCGPVKWTPQDNPFQANTRYAAEVSLTASPGYVFPADFAPTLNGAPATVLSNDESTLTLSYAFPPTAAQGEVSPPPGGSGNGSGNGFIISGSGCNTSGGPFGFAALAFIAVFRSIRRRPQEGYPLTRR